MQGYILHMVQHTRVGTCVPRACMYMFYASKVYIMWSVPSLLHVALLCALVRLNTRGILDMHHTSKLIMSAHSVNRQSHVVHHTNKLIMSACFTKCT